MVGCLRVQVSMIRLKSSRPVLRMRFMNNRLTSAATYALVATGAVIGSCAESQALESIDRYCVTSWRRAGIEQQEWGDCTQQVFLNLLQRVSRDQLIDAVEKAKSMERRELNRSIWCVTQRWRRIRRHGELGGDDIPPKRDVRIELVGDLREEVEERLPLLSSLQQSIIRQSLDGAAVVEIAKQVGVPPARVSNEKYKAVQQLRKHCAWQLHL